ncbi:hypothetical protein ACLOJK_021438 [Asimina triloba]
MPHDSPEQLRMCDCHMVSGAVDIWLFRSATVVDVARFKNSLEEAARQEGAEDEQGEDGMEARSKTVRMEDSERSDGSAYCRKIGRLELAIGNITNCRTF